MCTVMGFSSISISVDVFASSSKLSVQKDGGYTQEDTSQQLLVASSCRTMPSSASAMAAILLWRHPPLSGPCGRASSICGSNNSATHAYPRSQPQNDRKQGEHSWIHGSF